MLEDLREAHVAAPPSAAFAPIRRIGGANGYYYANWLWRVRGWMDAVVGGPGMRPRRDAETLAVGDVVDWWRVEAYERDRRLRLRAEMRVPGEARLEFVVTPAPEGGSIIRQHATYDPGGFWGRVYWTLMIVPHHFIFGGMLREIVRLAERE